MQLDETVSAAKTRTGKGGRQRDLENMKLIRLKLSGKMEQALEQIQRTSNRAQGKKR
ncbi:hypothetical protein [Treponema endosymbiont of Eucomonympha sp.]|uniref:hypothetical protein n=1 Tax=Treponema endosymbiont of Eucomonympha sp. TaxID=1580831 RepID=UPI000A9425F0|nr:hypothetical protein [Treponema endosymbiont of Eucomonympha sp.]